MKVKPEKNTMNHQKAAVKGDKLMGLIEEKKRISLTNPKFVFFILLLLCFLFYGNIIPNKYSLDDDNVVLNDQVKKGFSAIPEILTGLYGTLQMQDGQKIGYGYRPIVKVTFAIEYGLFGENPHVSHFINILLYFLAIWLLYRFLQRLFIAYHPLFPFLITVLFLAHPIHTEVVCSLKNRDELLSFIFSFVALDQFRKFATDSKWQFLFFGFLIFNLALLSKLSALSFIVVIPLFLFFLPGVNKKKILIILIVLIVASIMVKYLPRLFLPSRSRPRLLVENPMILMSIFERIPTALVIFLFYLKLVFIPFPMRFYYGVNMIEIYQWNDIEVWAALFILFALLISAIYYFKNKSWIFIGIILFLGSISIFLNVFQLVMGIVGDRFLFLPSLGFSIIIVGLLMSFFNAFESQKLFSKQNFKKVMGVVTIIVLIYFFMTTDRNKDWKDLRTLVENDVKHLENSTRANFMYAEMLMNDVMKSVNKGNTIEARKFLDEANSYYLQAVNVYPNYFLVYNALGLNYFRFLQDNKSGKENFEKCLAINPNFAPAYCNLAFIYFIENDFINAEKYYLEAINIQPYNQEYMKYLADVYKKSNQTEKLNNLLKRIKNTKKIKHTNQDLLPF